MIDLFKKLYKGSRADIFEYLKQAVVKGKKTFVVTANPEIFSKADKDDSLQKLLLDEQTLITPDGEGIVKGASMLGLPVKEKIAGVETVEYLLDVCAKEGKCVYFYGSKQEVLEALQQRLETKYPGYQIVGMKNGYDYKEDEVFQDMKQKNPDLILVALGVPRQEQVIYRHLDEFNKGVFIGVGGSLDVLSGTKKRAPQILIKCKLEWAYRLAKEPSRIKKFCHTHIGFIFQIRKLAKEMKSS